jgi:hypothetical protein
MVRRACQDLRSPHAQDARDWLLGEREVLLGRETILDAIDYPMPRREVVEDLAGTQKEETRLSDLGDEWTRAVDIRRRVGCSQGTVVAWWSQGRVEGCKARSGSTEYVMLREGEALQECIAQYHERMDRRND